jgi:hypothetical protein
VPVMVTEVDPVAAVLLAARDKRLVTGVNVFPIVMLAGLNDAVRPDGTVAAKFTVVLADVGVTVTVTVLLDP